MRPPFREHPPSPIALQPPFLPPFVGKPVVPVRQITVNTTPSQPLRILIIGSLCPPLGGCTVTLQCLVDDLRKREDVTLRIVNTSGIRGNGLRGALRLAKVIWRTARESFGADVVTLHVPTSALPYMGLWAGAIARLARKPFILRKFAGTDHWALGRWRGRMAHWAVSHADLYLVETHQRVHSAEQGGLPCVRWFPTNRPAYPLDDVPGTGQPSCRKFAYVGQVRRCKGIAELVAAVSRCKADVVVDVYGPCFQDIAHVDLTASQRLRYMGVLAPDEVVPTLRRYHATLLPTVASTEGYPGAVLESYLAGLPIIASACGAIPEIVDQTSGILVSAGDVEALALAIDRLAFDESTYRRLCEGARKKREEFSSEVWSARFLAYCEEMVYGAHIQQSVP